MSRSGSKRQRARELIDSWDTFLRPPQAACFFEDPPPLGAPTPSPAVDWWMAEICRFVYTPDAKEVKRFKVDDLRPAFLENTPLTEVANLHKTGTHIAIYRVHPPATEPWTLVVFRGTTRFRQWLANLTATPVQLPFEDGRKVVVHQGFRLLFDRIWPLLEPLIGEHTTTGKVVYTGHSLGGALAMFAALHRPPSAGVWTYGAPRVGNEIFRQTLEQGGVSIRRFVNFHDIVPLLPHSVESLAPFDFQHTGNFLFLDEDGTLIENPTPEQLGDDSWKPHLPITYLVKSMRHAQPPDCVLDHLMLRYCDKLKQRAEAS